MTEEKHIGSADPFAEDFNWFKFLALPVEEITEEAITAAYELSQDWVTCACGQVCRALPRRNGDEPKDEMLYQLGMSFTDILGAAYNEIVYGNNKEAKEAELQEAMTILHEIEQRTTELLQKL